jgi:tryptophanyl-tRNA synthetase
MKKTLFSGIKPSGQINIGGYIGAISQWPSLQDEYNCIFSVVDYHAITVRQDPTELKRMIIDVAKTYLASGIDPQRSIIFQQSTSPAHTELAWILNCYGTRMADLKKMTQFKDKAGAHQESVSVGLFDYPVLMAADILLYQTEIVPVGEDQVQHVELARDIAKRFNQEFAPVFQIPRAVINKEGARIMGLQNPLKKMSKSDNSAANYIELSDSPEIAKKKIQQAVTDSGTEVVYDKDNKPAISNLMIIYSNLSRQSLKSIEEKYRGRGYGDFKKDLAEVIGTFLTDFQERYNKFSDQDILDILEAGRQKAAKLSDETLDQVKKAIGVK